MLTKEQVEELHAVAAGRGFMDHKLLMDVLRHLSQAEENATAKDLALSAAKAMQQSETARADANERDANRYRYIRDKERLHLETCYGEAIMSTTFSSAEEFDEAVDQAMEDE